jgi:hypothetical protein
METSDIPPVLLKATNPKDALGSDRLPLNLIPPISKAAMSLAMLEGALKYGPYNWREAGVRTSIYISAIHRHLDKFADGEDTDPKTGVHHLASIMASCAIVLDSIHAGNLTDDRPRAVATGQCMDNMAAHVKKLKEMFAK